MRSQKLWNRGFISVCLSSFFVFLTFYTLSATLPQFVSDKLNGSHQQVGWVMTAFIISAVLFRPLAGRWLDLIGRRKVLIFSLLLFIAATISYFSVYSFLFLILLRFVHGISFGVATTANGTIAADIIPEKRKGEGMGYFALSMNLAMALGPFLGLVLIQHTSFTVLFAVTSLFAALALICGADIRLPKPAAPVAAAQASNRHWTQFIEPGAMPIALIAMMLSFAYSGILTFIPSYAGDLGMPSMASSFFVVYAVMIIVSRPFTGKLFDRFAEQYVIYPSLILYVLGLLLLSQAHTPLLFLASSAVIGLGFGTLYPCLQTIAIRDSAAHRRGLATSTFLLFYDIGIGLGSVILGSIASSTHEGNMYLLSAAVVAAAGLAYMSLLYVRQRKLRLAME
ncbi:MFS transporter [Cohnella kolymensis]|uniref:MFS transporter n=1 Tax=Cohnella kolymensis TaxID=1590652 RepID=UPI00069725C6|nr:MFS transporter [Cohnella kolymensis]